MKKIVQSFLKKQNVNYEYEEVETDTHIFYYDQWTEMGLIRGIIGIDQKQEMAHLHRIYLNPLPEKDKTKIVDYISRINSTSEIGTYILDRKEMIFGCRFLFYFSKLESENEKNLERYLNLITSGVKKHFRQLYTQKYGTYDPDNYLFQVAGTVAPPIDFIKGPESLRVGTPIRFISDRFIDTERIILEGMLGEVVKAPQSFAHFQHLNLLFSQRPCVSIYGTSEIITCERDILEVPEKKPNEKEKETSLDLFQNAFEHYEKKHGYTGFVKYKSKILPQEQLIEEVVDLIERITGWISEEEKDSHIKGNLKRLAKILRSFSVHPEGEKAKNLANAISNTDPYSEQIQDVFLQIMKWVELASKFERKKTEFENFHI